MDIPDHARFYLVALYKQGVFKGYPDGTFGPVDVLNRAQAATLIIRLMELFK
ncbi:MAG: S-layer homology domain-containing protein [Bacillota bacterium]